MKRNPQSEDEFTKYTRNIIWVALSQIITTILGIVILPVLTKSYSAESYGIWTQINVTNGLVVPILTLEFCNSVVRFLTGEENKTKRLRYLGAMFSVILIFSSVVFIAVFIFSPQVSELIFNNNSYTQFVLLAFLWTFADALFTFFFSYLIAIGQIVKLSIIQIAFSLSHMIVIVLFVSLHLRIESIITCMVVVDIVFAVGTLLFIIFREGFPALNLTGIRQFLLFSGPQIPSGLMAWVLASSDRFFITHFLGLSKNGVYSSSYVLGGILVLFYYPIGFMLFPAISKSWEQNKKDDVKNYVEYSIKLFLTFAIPAAAGLIILSQPILKIMTSSEYLAGWQLVLLVCVGTIFYDIAQINTYIIYLVKKTKWTLFATTISAIICASLEYFLIPKIGIMGGAVATIVSYFLFAFIVILLARKIISYHVNLVYLGKVSIATFLMVLFVYFLKADSILRIIVAVIGGAAIFAGAILLLKTLSEQDKRLIKQFISGFLLKKNEKSE